MKARIGVDPGSDDKTSFVIVRQVNTNLVFTPAPIEPHPNQAIEYAIQELLKRMEDDFRAWEHQLLYGSGSQGMSTKTQVEVGVHDRMRRLKIP